MKPTKNTNNCHSRENGNPAKASVWTGNLSRHCEEVRRSNPLSPNANGLPHSAPLRSQWQAHHHRPSHGFTLVELIVVITILVILGTIAFTSLSGFAGGARDSSRVSDLANLSQGLELTYIKTGSYPNPDDSFSVTYSGGVLWTQGTIGDTVINILGSAGAKFSKKPMDPLTTTTPYTYSKLAYGNAYQLKTDWEGDSVAFFISQTYASSGNPTLAYIKGTYNGMVAKTQSGSTIYLLAVPSIITTQSGELNSAKFLIHGQTNSGGLTNAINTSKLLVYSSGSLPSNDMERILFASGIALAYSGTALASQSNIKTFIDAGTNTGTLATLWGGLLSMSLGGSASASSTPQTPVTYADCTFNTTPVIHNTSVPAYQTASVSFGNTCTQEQRTCTDGTLSGTYTFASCTVDGATGTFTLSASSVSQGTNPTISHNCSTAPTSYTSSNTSVATIAETTITTLSAGTTNITPVGWACADVGAKTLTVTPPPFVCGTSTVSDIDGNSYNTISMVGWSQCWMATNLRTTKNPDGSAITKWPSAQWAAGWTTDSKYYSCPPNSTNNGEDCASATTYGMLYQWSAAMNTGTTNITDGGQGICPNGWHVPTNVQWKSLVESQATTGCDGGTGAGAWECSPAGSKLAWGTWTAYAGGINETGFGTSGFNVQPSGTRYANGNYYYRAYYTFLWSSTALDASSAWRRYFIYSMPSVYRDTNAKAYGFSLRCLKD